MRTARRTGHSHNTHSGSSLSSSSLRGVTSIRLTQQNRSREWAAALSALLPTQCHFTFLSFLPHRPLLATRGTAPTPDPTRHKPQVGLFRDPLTRAHGRAGGLLRSGCAKRLPARGSGRPPHDPPASGPPRPLEGGGYRPPRRAPSSPRYRARRIAAPTKVRGGGSPRRPSALPKSCAWVSALASFAGGPRDSGRALDPPPSPPLITPPRLAPSWPHR